MVPAAQQGGVNPPSLWRPLSSYALSLHLRIRSLSLNQSGSFQTSWCVVCLLPLSGSLLSSWCSSLLLYRQGPWLDGVSQKRHQHIKGLSLAVFQRLEVSPLSRRLLLLLCGTSDVDWERVFHGSAHETRSPAPVCWVTCGYRPAVAVLTSLSSADTESRPPTHPRAFKIGRAHV